MNRSPGSQTAINIMPYWAADKNGDGMVMDESTRTVTRGWLIMWIGIALLAGGLLGLCLPVYLDSYDSWGMRVKCGNGYYAELVRATTDDQQSASGAVQPATSYVHQCKSALAHRRAWLIPVAALGAVILILELPVWSRAGSRSSAATPNEWSEDPTGALHEAEVLDRRYRSRRARSSDTTL